MITFTLIENQGTSSASLRPLKSFGAGHPDAEPVNESSIGIAAFASLTSHGHEGIHLEPLESLGADFDYGAAIAAFAPLTGEGYSGLVIPDYRVAVTTMVGLTTAGLGLTGGIGGATVSLEKIENLAANYAYSAVVVSFEPLDSIAVADVTYPDLIFSEATARAEHHAAVPVNVLTVTTAATVRRKVMAEAASTGTVASGVTARGRYHLLADSTGIVYNAGRLYGAPSSFVPVAATASHRFEAGETWLINAVTFAPSKVDGYYFDSLARLGPALFGAGPDGIFEFTGATDDGALIDASIITGREDFGVPNVKRVPYAYVTGTSEGKLQVRVIDDEGRMYTYETERALGDKVRSARFTTGQGLEMHLWQFEIRNKAGESFEIHHIDVLPQVLKRRVKR